MNTNVIEPITAEGVGTEKQDGDFTMKKAYTFRKLNSTDTFLMFRIVGKIGINEFTACFEKDAVKKMIATVVGGNQKDATAVVGISVILEVANVIMGNLPKCEAEIYQILANVSGMSVEDIKALDFATFTEMVIDFIKKDEFKDFIKVVSKSFKLEK